MKRHLSLSDLPITALLWNLLVVYCAYTLCRAAFQALNWSLYAGTLTFGHTMELFGAGLLFDTPAILYTNAIILLMFLLPLHWKERAGYYRVARWIYTVVNSIAVYINLMDCVYFPFSGKRTTASIFAEFSNESTGEMLKIFGGQFLSHWYLVLLAALITWGFWKLFRPVPKRVKRPVALFRYYVSGAIAPRRFHHGDASHHHQQCQPVRQPPCRDRRRAEHAVRHHAHSQKDALCRA